MKGNKDLKSSLFLSLFLSFFELEYFGCSERLLLGKMSKGMTHLLARAGVVLS